MDFMLTELNDNEYKRTITAPMIDITDTAEPAVDIWPYVQLLTKEGVVLDYVYENRLVEIVYGSNENKFHHVLLPTDTENIFIVLIVDLQTQNIKGHFRLNLNNEYGIR